jgi:hypothetical protein
VSRTNYGPCQKGVHFDTVLGRAALPRRLAQFDPKTRLTSRSALPINVLPRYRKNSVKMHPPEDYGAENCGMIIPLISRRASITTPAVRGTSKPNAITQPNTVRTPKPKINGNHLRMKSVIHASMPNRYQAKPGFGLAWRAKSPGTVSCANLNLLMQNGQAVGLADMAMGRRAAEFTSLHPVQGMLAAGSTGRVHLDTVLTTWFISLAPGIWKMPQPAGWEACTT